MVALDRTSGLRGLAASSIARALTAFSQLRVFADWRTSPPFLFLLLLLSGFVTHCQSSVRPRTFIEESTIQKESQILTSCACQNRILS